MKNISENGIELLCYSNDIVKWESHYNSDRNSHDIWVYFKDGNKYK